MKEGYLIGQAAKILIFYAKEENWPANPCLSKNSPKTERDQGELARDWLDANVKDWRDL